LILESLLSLSHEFVIADRIKKCVFLMVVFINVTLVNKTATEPTFPLSTSFLIAEVTTLTKTNLPTTSPGIILITIRPLINTTAPI
jgi:hypothetical protein